MSARGRLIPYPEERALENAAYAQWAAPTRIFAVLLPVWCVEVKATVTDGEPYDLIDRFLERGLAEAGLHTAADLAGFFALDEVLVDRALRFLTAIGHVRTRRGQLALTELGQRSVRDQRRYIVTRHDRRRMYFDAFGSRPLPRAYYDGRAVTLLSGDSLQAAIAHRDGPRFLMLHSTHGFRRDALTNLARAHERDRYNLPARVDKPASLGEEQVYLPLYVVRALQHGDRVRYLAYTQVSDEADPDLTAICEQTAEIVDLFETEERTGRYGLGGDRARDWLRNRSLDRYRPVRQANGMWRATFPAATFDSNGPLAMNKLGSFVVLGNDCFQAWCADERTRRRALLERLDAYLGSRTRVNRPDAVGWITQVARQLELGDIDIPALSRMAGSAGRNGLAAQLDSLV